MNIFYSPRARTRRQGFGLLHNSEDIYKLRIGLPDTKQLMIVKHWTSDLKMGFYFFNKILIAHFGKLLTSKKQRVVGLTIFL